MAPWSFTWKEIPEGTYHITAAATDNSNARTVSDPVTVVVEKSTAAINQIPTVSISSPGNNQTFYLPSSISITASAADPDGTIARVDYYMAGEKIGESTSPPFTITFEFDSAGTYEITAMAFDNLYASAISEPVRITINPLKPNPDLITLYPNPNHGFFSLEIKSSANDLNVYDIAVVSLTGSTVCSYLATSAEITRAIDISDSPGGNYIVMVSSGGRVISSKQFIKL